MKGNTIVTFAARRKGRLIRKIVMAATAIASQRKTTLVD
jgi:hypothetical protein